MVYINLRKRARRGSGRQALATFPSLAAVWNQEGPNTAIISEFGIGGMALGMTDPCVGIRYTITRHSPLGTDVICLKCIYVALLN